VIERTLEDGRCDVRNFRTPETFRCAMSATPKHCIDMTHNAAEYGDDAVLASCPART
jgi:hypothetical protein